MSQTQVQEILRYMVHNGSITPLKASNSIGCMRLSARIADLESLGVRIDRKTVDVHKRYGGQTRVTEYSLNEKTNIETVEYILGHKRNRRWECQTE